MTHFKDDLSRIFQKYPFLHIDKSGELTIIVPLTGAQKITENISKDTNRTMALHIFGDNTCKADLERRKFFQGTQRSTSNIFKIQFPNLIKELNQLSSDPELLPKDHKFLLTIIDNLKVLCEQVDTFQTGNPGYEEMKSDLEHREDLLVAKGEFIVKVRPDSARPLNLPNIMSLTNPGELSTRKLVPKVNINEYLNALSQIKAPVKKNRSALIPKAIAQIPDTREYLNRSDNKSPKELFLKIYQYLQKKDSTLADQSFDVFENMEENFAYLCEIDDDFNQWSDDEILNAVDSVFNNADILKESTQIEQKSFEAIYQNAVAQYEERHLDPQKIREDKKLTYQLFILQTFLYLCTVELRLKNKEIAKSFIHLIQDTYQLNKLIVTLCTDEKEFSKIMSKEFQLSAEEYQSILDATFEISIHHLEADHYDELRVACVAETVHDSNYLIMGGRLCWSMVPITEDSNLNSPEQQKQASALHFETFYKNRDAYMQRSVAFKEVRILLDKTLKDELEQNTLTNLIHELSNNQSIQLLTETITNKKYAQTELLIEHSNLKCSYKAITPALKQSPIPTKIIQLFFKKNPEFAQYIEGADLIKAVQSGDLQLIKLILLHRPELLEHEDNMKQTAFLWACRTGQIEAAAFLMTAGANIHSRTVVPLNYIYETGEIPFGGRSARQWAEHLSTKDPQKAAMFKTLFANYYQQLEHQLITNPAYREHFTKNHITQAIEHGDLNLINLVFKHRPDLKKDFSDEDLIRAQHQLEQNNLREQVLPYQEQFNAKLEQLQVKTMQLVQKSGGNDELCQTLYKLNIKLNKARNQFFNYEITAESFKRFHEKCKQALQNARPILAQHRGWHNFPVFIRAILGVISALTVLPALAIQCTAPNGFKGTFFDKKEAIKTDSAKKLDQFDSDLESLNSEMNSQFSK
ncbi:Dot/Icm T4SS effector AnkF/LegA14/Ceg31 [Legionella bononiensis]|uniref:Ankyrin repeat domain-containing protein n=1 Tax=Legionella bononiensis TaxID=2793102 RepID=A0ABS1W6Q2_9GAMM|nr:Dot/Icm T4SS effector AnkF/LegA14/Ceg31 [Legionella bononiensis]MBL7478444.1 ankyrin repeat domain-containing protein [Legionella bononiensis]MBL7525041.1 ankyrin repeat domain-containing protein [Legionella bononiensis]MBL7561337.1 ankyrin repeat domain-containing protein [Legionella bononiensis]